MNGKQCIRVMLWLCWCGLSDKKLSLTLVKAMMFLDVKQAIVEAEWYYLEMRVEE